MAGRPPKPARLKLVEGRSAGRDSGGRVVPSTPAFARTVPEPPPVLRGEALAEWHRVLPELLRLELVKAPDAASLAAYCLTWERLVAAQEIVDAEGMVLHDDNVGRAQRHPALLTVEAASRELRSWAQQFGLTPSAESRLRTPKGDDGGEANPFAGVG
jgi:P27 family predicted phage terminase small subunit